jgi:small subunit ribosomal protein S18
MGNFDRSKNKSSDGHQKEKGGQWRRNSFKKQTSSFKNSGLKLDYKDVRSLQKFVSERGKIMPCRISVVSTKRQRTLALAIKRARFLALLPYVSK